MSVDYLIIGNITRDLQPDGGYTIGGTVTYSARTASAMDCQVSVVTSAAPSLDLDEVLSDIDVERIPSEKTMTFENVYTAAGREQYLHALALPLTLGAVPQRWHQPDVIHLAPLAGECDPALADAFPGALVCVTPQGWMRAWDDDGRVHYSAWRGAAEVLPRVNAAVLSIKDVAGDEAMIEHFAQLVPILVVTLGPEGCRVYAEGDVRRVPVTPVPEFDPTGAGDIFAAAFFVRLHQSNDPWSAAHFANCVASVSVKRAGWAGTPTRDEIAAAC